MYRKYLIYIDDGELVYTVAVAAVCEEAARSWVKGNGEVIAVKDVTEEYIISSDDVHDALKNANFDEYKIDIITRLLSEFGIVE